MATTYDSSGRGYGVVGRGSVSTIGQDPRFTTDEEENALQARFDSYRNPETIDPYAEIKRQQAALLAAQKQARINALSGQRESAMSALGQEESKVAPMYLQQRGNLSTTAQQTARSAEQALAARGLTRGGSAVQGDIARNVALQQGMSSIGTAEAGTLADIQARRTQAEQAYAQGVAQAESESAATAAQNEIARLMQAQQAQEATVAEQAKQQFEMEKFNQTHANNLEIERLRQEATKAENEGNHTKALELLKQKDVYEKENMRLDAQLNPSKRSGGGGTPKVTEGQLNTLINNFNSAISANPYYKYVFTSKEEAGDPKFTTDAQKAKIFNDYLSSLDSKVAAGAIDPATANSMYNYVQQNPEFQRLAPTIMSLRK